MDQAASTKKKVLRTIAVMAVWVTGLWIIEIVDQLFLTGALDQYGVRPRTIDGLKGILFAPFLHGDFAHLASNTIPLIVLGLFVMLRGHLVFFVASIGIIILGGFGTWLIGSSDSVHIGASGLIFGYLGFLLGGGIFERSFKTILLAIIAGLIYGGLIWGIMPGQVGISWEGHLFGFAGGVVLAKLFSNKSKDDE